MTVPAQYFFYGSAVFLFLSFPVYPARADQSADDSVDKGKIEFFIDGKNYPSFDAYQKDKLRIQLKEALKSASEQQFVFLKDLLNTLAEQDLHNITLNELQRALSQIRPDGAAAVNVNLKDEDITEMRDILREYREKHDRDISIEIDKDKMKTITIEPGR